MKTWYKLDEKCGTNTPRELIEILLQDHFTKRKSFAEAVLKQGWASRKQLTVLYEMKRQHNQAYTYPGEIMMNGMIWDTKGIRGNTMEFNVGDWITTPDYPALIIIAIEGSKYVLHCPDWLVSSAMRWDASTLKANKAEIIGKGKKRWWWNFMPWKDCVCPFTRPSNLWYL